MPFRSVLALASLAAFSAVAQQTQNSTTNRLPEIVVTAHRFQEETIPLRQYPGNVTVITRREIENSSATTLPDLLRQQAGVFSLDTTGFGQDTRINMRGYGEKPGVLVLVDGVRVNDPTSGHIFGNVVALQDIERVEVVRGGSSTIYGEGAIGGVVNIITKSATRPFGGGASLAGGNLGYYAAHAEASGVTNQYSYRLSLDRKEWGGWREGTAFREWKLAFKPSVETRAGKLTLNYWYSEAYSETPGTLNQAQYNQNPQQLDASKLTMYEHTRHHASLDFTKEFSPQLSFLARVHGQDYSSKSTSPGYSYTANNKMPGFGGLAQLTYRGEVWGRANTLVVGGEAGLQDYHQTNSGTGSPQRVDYWQAGLFVQDNLALTDRIKLGAGVRYDHRDYAINTFSYPPPNFNATPVALDRTANVWSPKATLTYQFTPSSESWVSFSRAYRLPTGDDLLSGHAAFFPNPHLAPTDAKTIELGWRFREAAGWNGSLSGYYSRVKDDLSFDNLTFQNINLDTIKSGVELSLDTRPTEWLGLFLNGAYTSALIDGGTYNSKRLPWVAEWQATVAAEIYFTRNWTWRTELEYVANQVPLNDLNNVLGGNYYTVVNTKLRYRLENLSAFVSLANLADTRYEQAATSNGATRSFYPAPGRSVVAGLEYNF